MMLPIERAAWLENCDNATEGALVTVKGEGRIETLTEVLQRLLNTDARVIA